MSVIKDVLELVPPFDGFNSDVHEWIERMNRVLSVFKVELPVLVLTLDKLLVGHAASWWAGVPSEMKQSEWKVIAEGMIKNFSSASTKMLLHQKLVMSRQGDMSAIDFVRQQSALCLRVDRAMSKSMQIMYILSGLKDSLKEKLVPFSFVLTNELVVALQRIELLSIPSGPKVSLSSPLLDLNAIKSPGRASKITVRVLTVVINGPNLMVEAVFVLIVGDLAI